MNSNYFQPKIVAPNARLFSGTNLLENCAQQKPDKRTGWEMSRKVPSEVLAARLIDEHKQAVRDVVESFRPAPAPKLGILCKNAKGGGIQIVGHGHEDGTPRVVANFAEAKTYAASIGRSFAFMGAIHAKV